MREAAKQGNAFIEMNGVDQNGDALKGDNESFSVRAALPGGPATTDQRSRAAYDKYFDLLGTGIISIGESVHENVPKLKLSYKNFLRGKRDE